MSRTNRICLGKLLHQQLPGVTETSGLQRKIKPEHAHLRSWEFLLFVGAGANQTLRK